VVKVLHTTIEIAAPLAEVWEVLTDFPAHSEWNPFFASIEGTAKVGETLTVVARKGEGTGMTFRPTVLVADGTTLRWLGKLPPGGLFTGQHEFKLTELPNGSTRLDHSEQFTGILIPFLGKLLRETQSGFVAFNEALVARVAKVQH
jgi:hypothetical protein